MKLLTLALFPLGLVFFLGVWASLTFYPVWRVTGLFIQASMNSSSSDLNLTTYSTNLPLIIGASLSFVILLLSFVPFTIPFGSKMKNLSNALRFLSTLALTLFASLVLLTFEMIIFEIVNAFYPSASSLGVHSLVSASLLLGICLLLTIIGLLNALRITTQRIKISSPKISHPLKVSHISDVHIGSRTRNWMERIVSKIEQEQPDIVVITGDLFDSKLVTHSDLSPLLRLKNVYCCIGNHELMCGEEAIESLFGGLHNTKLLNDEAIQLEDKNFTIIGIVDCNKENEMLKRLSIVSQKLKENNSFSQNHFKILLHHRPHGFSHVANLGFADLMLSGHTHGGQIFIFFPFVKLAFWNCVGLFKNSERFLYVSPGSGTWGPLNRLMYSCQITTFELLPEEK